MPRDRRHDGPSIVLYFRHFAAVVRWKAAADIDHAQIDVGLREGGEHPRRGADCALPLSEIGLLRADVKRDPVWVEPSRASFAQQFDCHLGCAAELARQRPLRPITGDENAAKDARAWRGANQLIEFVS